MAALLRAAAWMVVYLVALASMLAAGRWMGVALERLVPGPPEVVLAAIVLLAGASLWAGYRVEERVLWGDRFQPSAARLERIGTRSPLLGGSAPAPLSLGFALGLLSVPFVG